MSGKHEVVTTIALLFCALVGDLTATDKIKINLRQSDAGIRQQILHLTPRGTSAKQVFQFLQSRLERDRDARIAGAPGQAFRSTMSVNLGHYHEMRSFAEGLFMFPTIVQATWLFDEHDKLRDIRVRRGVMAW
jgi:hypothetical protein